MILELDRGRKFSDDTVEYLFRNYRSDSSLFRSGGSFEDAENDHGINLWKLMLRCPEVNLKLNLKKF